MITTNPDIPHDSRAETLAEHYRDESTQSSAHIQTMNTVTESAPVIREDITEAEVIAAITRMLAKAKAIHPTITLLSIHATHRAGSGPGVRCDAHAEGSLCVVSLPTPTDAFNAIARDIKSPQRIAQEKRALAAGLVAEAEALEAKKA